MENLIEQKEADTVEAKTNCSVLKRIGRMIFRIGIFVLATVDFWLDLLLGIKYVKQGDPVYAFFTFLFTLVPTACGALYVIIGYLRRKEVLTLVD